MNKYDKEFKKKQLRSIWMVNRSLQSPERSGTNFFGYYSFKDIPAGETYVINVYSKRYQFNPQVINLTEDLNELNFIAFQLQQQTSVSIRSNIKVKKFEFQILPREHRDIRQDPHPPALH